MAKTKIEDITEKEQNEPFVASRGWWEKYAKRRDLGSVKLIGEAASADHEAAEKFPDTLKVCFMRKYCFLICNTEDFISILQNCSDW